MVLKCFTYNQHFVAMMNVINVARLNPPKEGHKHHIVPRCWFKMNNLPVDNSKENLVLLSYEDHIKVHKLSILCASTPEMKSKMEFAVHRLLKGNFYGMHHTEESKRKNAEKHKGKHHTEETRRKMSEAHKGRTSPMKGRLQTKDAKEKISNKLKGLKKPKRTPQHCKHLSESLKGKYQQSPEFRRMNSERQKGHKWSNGSLGMHWYNNGKENRLTYECPEGFVKGRMKNV